MTRAKITYDAQLMKTMSLFETVTKTSLKDCFNSGDILYFVVEPEHMGKAIGKQGKNAKMLENLLKRRIRILEYSADIATFIKNLVYPIIPKQVDINNDKVVITGQDTKSKALLIGRNSINLNNYKEIVKRYFEINEIRVV